MTDNEYKWYCSGYEAARQVAIDRLNSLADQCLGGAGDGESSGTLRGAAIHIENMPSPKLEVIFK